MTSTPLSAVARRFFMTSIWWRGSSEAVGSSARMTGASTASTRASATRLRSPPDNSVTRRSAEFHDVDRLHRAQHRLRIPAATGAPDRWRHADSGRAPRYRAPAAASARRAPAADSQSVLRARAAAATTAPRRRSRSRRRTGSIPPARATAWSCRRRSARPAPPDVPATATAKRRSARRGRPAVTPSPFAVRSAFAHATPPPSARRSRMIR